MTNVGYSTFRGRARIKARLEGKVVLSRMHFSIITCVSNVGLCPFLCTSFCISSFLPFFHTLAFTASYHWVITSAVYKIIHSQNPPPAKLTEQMRSGRDSNSRLLEVRDSPLKPSFQRSCIQISRRLRSHFPDTHLQTLKPDNLGDGGHGAKHDHVDCKRFLEFAEKIKNTGKQQKPAASTD